MANALAELALRQWAKIDRYTEHRRKLAAFYYDRLPDAGYQTPEPVSGSSAAPIRYPIACEKPEMLLAQAERRGLYLGAWYRPVISPPGVRYQRVAYQPGSCPHAEAAAATVVNLPTHVNIQRSDSERVVEILRQCGMGPVTA
mgnify:FL=1